MTTTPTTGAEMPEALRLADWLQSRAESVEHINAAAELRRLYALSAAAPAAPAVMDGPVPPSPINLWLVTEQDGKRHTVHKHSMASELGRDTQYPCKVEALQTMSVDVPAIAAWRTARANIFTGEIERGDWIDGAPSDDMLLDLRTNAPSIALEYAYAYAAPQAQQPGAAEAHDPHIPIKELLLIYDEKKGDWCGIAREVERRTIAAARAGAQAVPSAWYTDWPGRRIYADEPHGWDEPGLHLSGSSIADHWSPLYGAAPAAVSAPEGHELGEDGWPKLAQPAKTAGGTFGRGVSARLLVESCYRRAQHEAERAAQTCDEKREEERNRRALWDMVNGPISDAAPTAAVGAPACAQAAPQVETATTGAAPVVVAPAPVVADAESAPSVPEGWKPVPIELTDSMKHAAAIKRIDVETLTAMWHYLLAAAPQAPAQEGGAA